MIASPAHRPLEPATPARYTHTAQLLHWGTAGLMFTVLPLAWVMVNMPDTAGNRGDLFALHKSVGLTVLALTVVRLVWRGSHPAPVLPRSLALWEKAAAHLSHWLLYLILIGMPVSGYLLSAAGGHPVTYFGMITLPGLPRSEIGEQAGFWIHVVVGQWFVYALIAIHLLATAWHVVVKRDGVLDRMLPAQTGSRVDPPPNSRHE